MLDACSPLHEHRAKALLGLEQLFVSASYPTLLRKEGGSDWGLMSHSLFTVPKSKGKTITLADAGVKCMLAQETQKVFQGPWTLIDGYGGKNTIMKQVLLCPGIGRAPLLHIGSNLSV
jgi:hypothetical protein